MKGSTTVTEQTNNSYVEKSKVKTAQPSGYIK